MRTHRFANETKELNIRFVLPLTKITKSSCICCCCWDIECVWSSRVAAQRICAQWGIHLPYISTIPSFNWIQLEYAMYVDKRDRKRELLSVATSRRSSFLSSFRVCIQSLSLSLTQYISESKSIRLYINDSNAIVWVCMVLYIVRKQTANSENI